MNNKKKSVGKIIFSVLLVLCMVAALVMVASAQNARSNEGGESSDTESAALPHSDDVIKSTAKDMIADAGSFELVEAELDESTAVKRVFRESDGRGYAVYTLIGKDAQKTAAVFHIDSYGVIKNVTVLAWGTAAENKDAFAESLINKDAAAIESSDVIIGDEALAGEIKSAALDAVRLIDELEGEEERSALDILLGLFSAVKKISWKNIVMWVIGGILIFLAIKKEMEPTLLLPIGFGAILMNFPGSGIAEPLESLYNAGIANELFPLILFIGIGAMIDFGPLLNDPKLMIFGAAAQFGIFFTLSMAAMFFDRDVAASIAVIGAADGPTSIVVANTLLGGTSNAGYIGAIAVAAYSYMALVPIIQPPIIKLLTTKKERMIRMSYKQTSVSKTTKILFPILISLITCIFVPSAASLIGFLMFGNLIRECGVLDSLSETAQKVLANLVTIFLGITIAFQMDGEKFIAPQTLLILGLGLVAFIFDTAGGVLFAKLFNVILRLFKKDPINPMIGAAGISAFPMSGRIVHKMALKEDPQNFLLMHSIGVNVSGQIASVIAGSLILSFFA